MSWVQTFSGLKFFIADPRRESVRVADVAHSLSLICRFAGHCREFYSVGQHSIYVADWIENLFNQGNVPASFSKKEVNDIVLIGLLHDAAEAYIGDIPRPAKGLFGNVREYEDKIIRVVTFALTDVSERVYGAAQKFVKAADNAVLGAEARDLLPFCIENWNMNLGIAPAEFDIVPCEPHTAEDLFLKRFFKLVGQGATL